MILRLLIKNIEVIIVTIGNTAQSFFAVIGWFHFCVFIHILCGPMPWTLEIQG